MTPEEAHIFVNAFFRDAGLPEHVPIAGDVWTKATKALTALCFKDGTGATRMRYAGLAEAVLVLAKSVSL